MASSLSMSGRCMGVARAAVSHDWYAAWSAELIGVVAPVDVVGGWWCDCTDQVGAVV